MKRILIIGTFLSSTRGSKGSGETLALNLIREGYKVQLSSHISNRILRLFDMVLSVLFNKYDIIIIEGYSGLSFIFLEVSFFLARLREKKIILSFHGGKLLEFSKNNKKRIQRLFNFSTVYRSPSTFLVEGLKQLIPIIEYLPNSVDINIFSYVNNTPLIENNFNLLWVRAYAEIYNPTLAIKILIQLKKTYPLATLTMIGPDLGIRSSVETLIKVNKIEDSVRLIGSVNNENLPQYYHSHQIFLNTTSYESFGVAVVEAAACGIPIVSSKVGEIPYLWTHDENILLVEKLDAVLFSKQIIRIIENKALAQKLSINARKKAEEFDWEIIKSHWFKILS